MRWKWFVAVGVLIIVVLIAGIIGVFKPTAIEVSRVSIENLHLTFRETKTGSPVQFTIASLVMTPFCDELFRLADDSDFDGIQKIVIEFDS